MKLITAKYLKLKAVKLFCKVYTNLPNLL
jgi:hypothetical protein